MYIIEEIKNQSSWDQLVLALSGNLPSPYQLWHFGEIAKKIYGTEIRRMLISYRGVPVLVAQVYKIKILDGHFLYVPNGPIMTEFDRGNLLRLLADKLKSIGAFSSGVYRFKIEPKLLFDEQLEKTLQTADFYNSRPFGAAVGGTFVLDLRMSDDDLMAAMDQTTRRHLRVSMNKGVMVKSLKGDYGFEAFWSLFRETASRKRFYIFTKEWYKELFNPNYNLPIELFVADYNGENIAAAVIFYFHNTAIFLHGASILKKNVSGLKLLLLRAIHESKQKGALTFDFWGNLKVVQFKKGLGGHEIKYIGAHDYIF